MVTEDNKGKWLQKTTKVNGYRRQQRQMVTEDNKGKWLQKTTKVNSYRRLQREMVTEDNKGKWLQKTRKETVTENDNWKRLHEQIACFPVRKLNVFSDVKL